MNLFYAVVRETIDIVSWIIYRHRVYGKENLVKGGAILAANHASHWDPELLGGSIREPIHFLARETLFTPRLSPIIRRLNAHPIARGGGDLRSLKMIVNLLKQDCKVVVFPEGTRTYDGELQEGQAGVSMLSMRGDKPVIPIYIHGTYDLWPRGAKRPKFWGKTACVFGKPIYPAEFVHLPKREGQTAMAARTMEEIANLKKWYEVEHGR